MAGPIFKAEISNKIRKMSDQEKIKLLESRITVLENENLLLKSMWKQQTLFGNKMTQIVSEMDELLEKKKQEIESLTNQLLLKTQNYNDFNDITMPENFNDFSIDLESSEVVESKQEITFLQHQKQVKMKKERLEKEFERTKDGKFKCPYKDICNYASKHRNNLRKHICIHTGEKPYSCDICGRSFIQQGDCKKHMLTHPEMNGVQCNYCRIRISESQIESHQTKCARKQRKRLRIKSDPETL